MDDDWTPWPPTTDADAWRELVEERVAVMVVDGRVPEAEAQREAAAWYRDRWREVRAEERRRG